MKALTFCFVLLAVGAVIADDYRLNRTRLSSRRRFRLGTTEVPDDQTTLDTTTPSTTLLPIKYMSTISDKEAERERKWKELTKSKCGILMNNYTVPWIVVIEHTDPTGNDPRKTLSKGVLISDRYVLTTVSSVHNSRPFWVVSSVRLGDIATWITEISQRVDKSYKRIEIEQVYQHASKDIAIIKLANKVEFSEYVQPICLAFDDNYNFREMFLHLCKRSTEKNGNFDVRLQSSMPLTPQDCETLFHRKGAEFGAGEFCAWDEFGDNCMGDVGGPLMANFNGRFLVIGLYSYVFTPEEFEAEDYPGVYVKVGSHLKWINSILALN